jgi:hypothetical protein
LLPTAGFSASGRSTSMNLTFARAAEEFSDGDSGRSQVASIHRE